MTSTRRGRPDAPTLMYEIKQVELAIRAHLDGVLKPAGITATQYTALTVLRQSGAMSAAALARRSFVRPQSMADMVGALQRRNLVARAQDSANHRQLLIALTPAGRELLADYDLAVHELEQAMLAGLSDRQRRDFRRYLDACRSGLANHRIER